MFPDCENEDGQRSVSEAEVGTPVILRGGQWVEAQELAPWISPVWETILLTSPFKGTVAEKKDGKILVRVTEHSLLIRCTASALK